MRLLLPLETRCVESPRCCPVMEIVNVEGSEAEIRETALNWLARNGDSGMATPTNRLAVMTPLSKYSVVRYFS